ncbi:MAG: hypothetical protein J6S23_01000 [Clostridia bacterium]|nr:hypothetical protein [Clostridia bacterium]
MAENQAFGYLIVKVSTASGAIPVEKVTVVIQGNDADNQSIFFSRVTNRDGLTEKITLPSPDGALSNAPNPSSRPYSTYNIDVYKEGYYPQHYNNVPIFAGITAVQNARIVPIAEFDAQNPYYTQGQNFDEYENPFL